MAVAFDSGLSSNSGLQNLGAERAKIPELFALNGRREVCIYEPRFRGRFAFISRCCGVAIG